MQLVIIFNNSEQMLAIQKQSQTILNNCLELLRIAQNCLESNNSEQFQAHNGNCLEVYRIVWNWLELYRIA